MGDISGRVLPLHFVIVVVLESPSWQLLVRSAVVLMMPWSLDALCQSLVRLTASSNTLAGDIASEWRP